MRVGVVGPVGPERFAENVGDAAQRLGHQVTLLGPARAHYRGRNKTLVATFTCQALPRLEERAQHRLVQRSLDAACDVVISVDLRLMPAAVSGLKRGGARVAFWFPDHVANLGRQLMLLASYDSVFLKEPHLVERLRAVLGMSVYYLPEACNPRWHRPLVVAGTEPYLIVAGNMYPYRLRLTERLIAKGIPVKLYGPSFPRWIGSTPARNAHTGRCVFGDEKARVFRSAAGVLNTMHPAEIAGANGRLFQAAGCGAAILTEFRPTVPELFAIGDEVLAYRDFDELLDNAARLLTESGLSARLGDAAARRAHRDHTYDHRVKTIMEAVL